VHILLGEVTVEQLQGDPGFQN